MSRLFDDGVPEHLIRAEVVDATPPLAFVCWFNTNDLGVHQCLISNSDEAGANNYRSLQIVITTGTLYAVDYATGAGIAESTSGVTINTWHHACAIFVSATDRRVLLDGGSKGTNATDITPINLDNTCIGRRYQATPVFPMSGMIAEAAIYDLSAYPGATDSDKADYFEANVLPGLAAGEIPDTYPTGLTAYWPLETTSLDDEAGSFDLTASGTSVSTHPPTIRMLTGSTDITVTTEISAKEEALLASSAAIVLTTDVDTLLGISYELAGSAGINLVTSANINLHQAYFLAAAANILISTNAGIYKTYADIPPVIHKDLIDPYSGGAWLWLCEIAVPGYAVERIARNTEDVRYGGNDFDKFNLQIGEQMFSGDGSIPRVTLRVFQDVNRIIEDMVNETEGALGAGIKLIRVCEKYLDTPISALEADYESLAAESDSEWVTFTLGIPNPLTQRIPLRIYSSSSCPWATPSLFKGPECQYAGADPTCTGTYEDCYTKGNAVHWGGELGLDPNVI